MQLLIDSGTGRSSQSTAAHAARKEAGMRRCLMSKKLAASIAGTLMMAAFGAAAPSAQAAARDGVCETGEFCLYFNSDQKGSVSDFASSISNYGSTQPECYEFKGAGLGQGRCVKNNAASVWNRTSGPVTVYFNSGHVGPNQTIASGAKDNLNATLKNENASHKFEANSPATGGPETDSPQSRSPEINSVGTDNPGTDSPRTNTTARTNMSFALYNNRSGRMTAGFDGYRTTNGAHEGIDFALKIGSAVHALVEGRVIKIVRGAPGRRSAGSLSTIAIYSPTHKRTIIYLHAAPLAELSEGQSISRGQRIATESWRGVSKQSSAHTHVEMRRGARTRAAKSVNDPELTNENPTRFWNKLGYNVR